MFHLPSSVRIFLSTTPADMRCGFEGLSAQVTRVLEADPLSGHLFVFRNRRCDRIKILYWDRSGYSLWYKRLEKGTFRFPVSQDHRRKEVDAATLTMILEGIDLTHARRRVRYQRPTVTCEQ